MIPEDQSTRHANRKGTGQSNRQPRLYTSGRLRDQYIGEKSMLAAHGLRCELLSARRDALIDRNCGKAWIVSGADGLGGQKLQWD